MAISIIVNIGTVGASITNVEITESPTLGGTYTVIPGQTNVLVSAFPVTITTVANTTTYLKINDLGACGEIQTIPIGSLPRPDAFQFKATSGDGSLGFAFDPTMWAAGEYDAQLVYAGNARYPDDATNTQDNATTIQPLQLPLKVAYNPLNNQTVSTGADATKELLWQIYTTNNDPLKFPGFSHAKFTPTLSTPDIVWRYKDITNWGTTKFKYFQFGRPLTTAGTNPGRDGFTISDTNYPDLTRCTNLQYCFSNCGDFNSSNVTGWNTSNVENMTGMFRGLPDFNQDIGSWDVTSVTKLQNMFGSATSFNQDLSSWQLTNLQTPAEVSPQTMNNLFNGATSFNNGSSSGVSNSLNSWATYFADQKNFISMFSGATAFNSNLSDWDVGSGTNFNFMFSSATSLNFDISNWDTGAAIEMKSMFSGASNFNPDLSSWNFINVAGDGLSNFLSNSGISTANYGALLERLRALGQAGNLNSNVTLGATNIQFPASAAAARTYLTTNKSWNITDAGQA